MDELTKEEFEVIFDVLNVYEPNDISHVYPAMGEEKFMEQLGSAWKKVLDIVSEPNDVITENYSVDIRRKN
tara:strand:+ start:285 stop:497 length:213 start_codon:yes stop_codon:yes gene_type:complete